MGGNYEGRINSTLGTARHEGDAITEGKSYIGEAVVEDTAQEDVLRRVLYPEAHGNGIEIKIKIRRSKSVKVDGKRGDDVTSTGRVLDAVIIAGSRKKRLEDDLSDGIV